MPSHREIEKADNLAKEKSSSRRLISPESRLGLTFGYVQVAVRKRTDKKFIQYYEKFQYTSIESFSLNELEEAIRKTCL